jgi:hypothetical protein
MEQVELGVSLAGNSSRLEATNRLTEAGKKTKERKLE